MGKKTVPIVVRVAPKRKGHKTTESDVRPMKAILPLLLMPGIHDGLPF